MAILAKRRWYNQNNLKQMEKKAELISLKPRFSFYKLQLTQFTPETKSLDISGDPENRKQKKL